MTLRTAAGLPAIETIARTCPSPWRAWVSTSNSRRCRCACEAVARFAVSPGYSRMGSTCKALHLPLLPGVAKAAKS